MNNLKTLGALIGLAGAIGNNGKTQKTDHVIIKALLSDDSPEIIELIHKEKFTISPGCETCASPCGNTSDFDLTKVYETDKNTLAADPEDIERTALKLEMICELKKQAERYAFYSENAMNQKVPDLPDAIVTAIMYLKYDLKKESYLSILEELRK